MSITPEQLQAIIDRLPTADSLRQIAREMELQESSVRDAARPFVVLLRATGALGDCACGKPRFHPYGCVAMRVSDGTVERREMIIGLMLDGMPIKQIARAFGTSPSSIRELKRFLTPEQREKLTSISAQNIKDARRLSGERVSSAASDPRLVKALTEGRSYSEIYAEFGFSNGRISRAVRKLTPEQRACREAMMAAKRDRIVAERARGRGTRTGRFGQKTHVELEPIEWRIAA